MKTISRALSLRFALLILILGAFSLLAYVLVGCRAAGCGYPLDDAWIHQTYARNLGQLGEWSFIPGETSGGSTSPLWTLILAFGYKLSLSPLVWTYFLGGTCLVVLAYLFQRGFLLTLPDQKRLAFVGAIGVLFEWHLVWAAGSGMETLLAATLGLAIAILLLDTARSWLWVGIMIGASAWIRPDGVTWLFPALWIVLFEKTDWQARMKNALILIGATLVILIPYSWLNYHLSGMLLPTTFFAKQAEYAVLRNVPLWRRLLQQIQLPLVGAGALLLPGFIIYFLDCLKNKDWGGLGIILWLAGYVGMYAIRLPVTYQHGRYLIPMMPVYFYCGYVGMCRFIISTIYRRWYWVLARTWEISVILLLVVFWGLGLRAYRQDVSLIQTEMVAAARWVAAETEPDVLVAAHDIGALGYFGKRDLLDLAGLVSPMMIPYLNDETSIRQLLNDHQVNYLVTFPGWYPQLTQDLTGVYESGGEISKPLGGENMVVYLWAGSPK